MASLTNEYDAPALNNDQSEIQSISLMHQNLNPTNNNDPQSSSEITDIVANYIDSEPTIIDAWNAFLHKFHCCCKCNLCKINPSKYNLPHEFTQDNSSYQFVDEVAKIMNENDAKLDKTHKRVPSLKNKNNASFPHHHKIFSVDPVNDNFLLDSTTENNSPLRELQTALMRNEMYHSRENSKSKTKSLQSNAKRLKREARMRCYCIPCLRYKPKIWQLISVSIVVQCLAIVIMGSIEAIPDATKQHKFRLFAQVVLSIFWLAQSVVMIQLVLICAKRLWDLTFFQIVELYLTSIIIFTGVYTTAYFYDNSNQNGTFNAFNLSETEFADCTFMERCVAFLYLSCSQQTLCGVCEIIPKSPPTMFLCGLQMLFGIFFSIIIISIGISRLGEDIEKRHKTIQKRQVSSLLRSKYDNLVPDTYWQQFTHNERVRKCRTTTRAFLLFIVIVIQATKNLLEWITTDSSFADRHNRVHAAIFIVFDFVNVMVVLVTSLKFLHVGHMTELRLSFLCQTYLSVMLIFTGIYVDLQCSQRNQSSDGKHFGNGAFVTGEETYAAMWTKFVYFSFAMMTLCGAGLDIKPRTWYAAFAMCNEMLLGLFFHVYIFGIGLLLLANNKYASSGNAQRDKRADTVPSLVGVVERRETMAIGSELILSTLLDH